MDIAATSESTAEELAAFLALFEERLSLAAADHPAESDIRGAVTLLSQRRRVITHSATATSTPTRIPVRDFWDVALTRTGSDVAMLAEAVGRLEPHLTWAQNPHYRRRPPTPNFLENYGYAIIVDVVGGAEALAYDDQLSTGVVMLGPHTEYPPHHHPSVEEYLPLTAAEWWHEGTTWHGVKPGTVIHHGSNVAHAMRTGEDPLLALYLWHGDLGTSSTWT